MAIWTQGCARHCKGCFAVKTWSFEEKKTISAESLASLTAKLITKYQIEGITILGGEPLEQKDELERYLSIIPRSFSVILFTGFTMDELLRANDAVIKNILSHTDVLVDGPFIEEKKQTRLPMIGSSNQTFHFLTDRYSISDFPENRLVFRINKSGGIALNGMGDLDVVKKIVKEQGYEQK